MTNTKLISFVNKYAAAIYSVANRYTLPYDAMLAQAALESKYGANAFKFNFFGIKANSAWTGAKQLLWTKEYDRTTKTYVKRQSWFRAYSSAEEGFDDYAKFILGNRRYNTAVTHYRNFRDSKEYLKLVSSAGYATDPHYSTKTIKLLENMQPLLVLFEQKKK